MSYQITILPANEIYYASHEESLLNAAINQGIMLPHACKSGCCGACKAQLVSGKTAIINNEAALNSTDENNTDILLCCQSPKSDVSIYLPNYHSKNTHTAQTLSARIHDIRYCGNVAVVGLQLPAQKTFSFNAGQYFDIILANNIRRSYSIAYFNTATNQLIMHVRHHPGGAFSAQLFDGRLQIKDVIRIHGPLGNFQLSNQQKPIIMLASGTGLAPIEAMLATLTKQQYQHSIDIYWGVSTEQDLYDANLLDSMCLSLPNAKWTPVLSRPSENWRGKQGYVQNIALAEHTDMSQYEVYACGHPQMISTAQTLLTTQANLPEDAFFADNFTPAI